MRILLTAINAKYIHSNPAVYSLRASAKEFAGEIGLAEFTINQSKDEILKGIFRRKPEVLCVSCYIWNISLVEELVRETAKVLPGVQIWLGGPEVSYDAREVLRRNPAVRGIMKGEGETVFGMLASHYLTGSPRLEDIPGLTWQKEIPAGNAVAGNGREREERQEICDSGWPLEMSMDEIPFIYRELKNFENRILYYESSRGCPFSCSYCLSSVDKRLRFRSLELVKEELQFFLDHRVRQVKFVDRTFNCDHGRAMEIWRYLTEHDNGVTNFHFEIAADLLTDEEMELIASMRPGMIQLEIGVQSTNRDTIRAIRRRMDFDRVIRAVKRLSAPHNVHLHLDLIAGLPMEDHASFGRSFDQVYALKPQQLQLGFLKVLKGSRMHQEAVEYGCLYHEKEPYEVLMTRWLSYEDVLRLKQTEEMVEVYYNSGQFLWTLPAVEPYFSSPFSFYSRLGEFYDRKGYLEISHNRLRRYEILEEFLRESLGDGQDTEGVPGASQQNGVSPEKCCRKAFPDGKGREEFIFRIRELMTLDLYSRENLKSRPAWAGDTGTYRRAVRNFYHREAEEHRYLPGYEDCDEKQLQRMTHLERVTRDPVSGKPGERYFLFDYRQRDCLTQAARCLDVTAAVSGLGENDDTPGNRTEKGAGS